MIKEEGEVIMNHDTKLLLILAALVIKHFVWDFVFQNGYILMGKGKPGLAFVKPLALHAGEHALSTSLIFAAVNPSLFWIGFIDFIAHFVIDRIKATHKIGNGGVWAPEDKIKNLNAHYLALGMDQMGHYLTYIFCLAIALQKGF